MVMIYADSVSERQSAAFDRKRCEYKIYTAWWRCTGGLRHILWVQQMRKGEIYGVLFPSLSGNGRSA